MAMASLSAAFTIGQPVNPLTSPRHFSRGPSLADDSALYASRTGWVDRSADSDYECFTWPDEIDQTRINAVGFSRFANDDMEIDDGV